MGGNLALSYRRSKFGIFGNAAARHTALTAPLFSAIPGYVSIGVRGGWRAGPHELVVDVLNLTDRNYRGISWGSTRQGSARRSATS